MILDRLDRLSVYSALGANWQRAISFLQSTDLTTFPLGRHAVDGERVAVIVEEYAPKPVAEGRWESHRRYADIQCIVRGAERMGVVDVGRLTVKDAHDPARDIAFYAEPLGVGRSVEVVEHDCLIFFPHDAHMPSLAGDQTRGAVRKVVMKVELEGLRTED